MKTSELLMLSIGAILVWAGIKNKNPITTVRDVLTGKPAGK